MSPTKDQIVIIAILPFIHMMMGLYIFSCLPLHMTELKYDLVNFGLVIGASVFLRMMIPLFGTRITPNLEKLTIPNLVLALGAGLASAFFPTSEGLCI